MNRRSLFAWPAAVLALGLGGAALAAPAPKSSGADAETLVVQTHGCHRSCEIGPAGWHRHVGPLCVRVACVPRAAHPHRCFVDRWGVRHCRW